MQHVCLEKAVIFTDAPGLQFIILMNSSAAIMLKLLASKGIMIISTLHHNFFLNHSLHLKLGCFLRLPLSRYQTLSTPQPYTTRYMGAANDPDFKNRPTPMSVKGSQTS